MSHSYTDITTLGELKKSNWKSTSVKEEIQKNLLAKINSGENFFPDIYGYEDSVEVQIVNALLSHHNLILLGLRGQGKTKLIRLLVNFLDEYVPVIDGTELNENPYHPISPKGRSLVKKHASETPIRWLHRNDRFNEKLATPDVSIADLIGDMDPIRAAREKLDISDSETIHWGIVPRSNRGIFSINELPDLQPRIQVSLFNILEEKDIQIRGFPLRIPLDILLVFTANPEDYTNRGRIITPLKDRIGSQIITHYPKNLKISKQISLTQVAPNLLEFAKDAYPEEFLDIIENIVFVARKSEFTDKFSGISQRLAISAIENSLANIFRRISISGEEVPQGRVMDIYASLPAITGKIELIEERGENELIRFASGLIQESIKEIFDQIFPPIFESESKEEDLDNISLEYREITDYFKNGKEVKLQENWKQKKFETVLKQVNGLEKFARFHAPNKQYLVFYMEMILEGLCVYRVVHRKVEKGYLIFNNLYSSMFQAF